MDRNRDVREPGKDTIDISRSIEINAPVERVFQAFSDFQNFPRFMHNVREVRETSKERLHWTVAGPLGATVEWDAAVTEFVPNQVIAWRSEPGSQVEQMGNLYFRENPDGTTRVDCRLSYNPPGGGLGHALASLFGANPESQLEDDLGNMKKYIESGQHPGGETTAQTY